MSLPEAPVGYAEAFEHFRRRAVAVQGSEQLSLSAALGRVLVDPVIAPRDVPAFDNAALDGFAFAWTPAIGATGGVLRLIGGRSAAGLGFAGTLGPGEAVSVLTGAPIPAGSDTVVPLEACRRTADQIQVPAGLARGANRRRRADDVATGSTVLAAGIRLGGFAIGMAAATGQAILTVRRRPRVALLSTGDELLAPGEPFRLPAVYDANRPMLGALLADLPVELVDLGIVRDEPDRVTALLAGLDGIDLLLTSGGASQSATDLVVREVARRGELDFWRVRIKPGRPLALGALGAATFVGLPGNPVAAALCLVRFVRPLLLGMAGAGWQVPRGRPVRAALPAPAPGRTELVRCRLITDADGGELLQPYERQGSAVLTGLLASDGIAEATLPDRATVPFLTWRDLGLN